MPEKLSLDLLPPILLLFAAGSLEGPGFGAGEAPQSASVAGHLHRRTPCPALQTPSSALVGREQGPARVHRWNQGRKARDYEEKGFSTSLLIFLFFLCNIFPCVTYSLWKSFHWFTLIQCLVSVPLIKLKAGVNNSHANKQIESLVSFVLLHIEFYVLQGHSCPILSAPSSRCRRSWL